MLKECYVKSAERLIENEEKAEKTWDCQKDIKKTCNEVLEKLAGSSLSPNEVVCFTLLAIYLRTIASHLTNIANSVIVPLSDIDYYDEKKES